MKCGFWSPTYLPLVTMSLFLLFFFLKSSLRHCGGHNIKIKHFEHFSRGGSRSPPSPCQVGIRRSDGKLCTIYKEPVHNFTLFPLYSKYHPHSPLLRGLTKLKVYKAIKGTNMTTFASKNLYTPESYVICVTYEGFD